MTPLPRSLRAALTAAALLALATSARAAQPRPGGQAPGWYRMTLGSFEITALSDGTLDLDVDKLLTGTTPSGARVEVRGTDHLEFRDGQIVRKDSYWKIVDV